MSHSVRQDSARDLYLKEKITSIVSDAESDTDGSTRNVDSDAPREVLSSSRADDVEAHIVEDDEPVSKREMETSAVSQPSQSKRQRVSSSWDRKKQLVQTASGDLVYKYCPSLDKDQQYKLEYSLPLVLPLWFTLSNLSRVALYWTIVIVVGHSIETYLTSFGPTSAPRTRLLDAMTHHMIDCLWLQTMISAMVIWPSLFGMSQFRVCIIAEIVTILIPIYLSVSYKSYYCMNTSENTRTPIKNSSIGQHIQSCFLWYGVSGALIAFGFFDSPSFATAGIVALNASPVVLTKNFMSTFNKMKDMDDETLDTEESSETSPLLS